MIVSTQKPVLGIWLYVFVYLHKTRFKRMIVCVCVSTQKPVLGIRLYVFGYLHNIKICIEWPKGYTFLGVLLPKCWWSIFNLGKWLNSREHIFYCFSLTNVPLLFGTYNLAPHIERLQDKAFDKGQGHTISLEPGHQRLHLRNCMLVKNDPHLIMYHQLTCRLYVVCVRCQHEQSLNQAIEGGRTLNAKKICEIFYHVFADDANN